MELIEEVIEIRRKMAEILKTEMFEGIEGANQYDPMFELTDEQVKEFEDLRTRINEIMPKIKTEKINSKPETKKSNTTQEIDDIRKEMARLLKIEPFEGIEGTNQYDPMFELTDEQVKEFEDLRTRINEIMPKIKTEKINSKPETKRTNLAQDNDIKKDTKKTEDDSRKRKSAVKDNTKEELDGNIITGLSKDIDMKAFKKELYELENDMLNKYYGNKEVEKQYRKRMKEFKSHIVEKEFSYIDENGKKQTGTYSTIEPYEGYEEDIKFLQLETYKEKLERITKSNYVSYFYKNDEEKEADMHYIETNNDAYNRLALTEKHLATLGKFGEKAPTIKTVEGQYILNGVKHCLNGFIHVRNTIIAPINKLAGHIISPVYGKVSGARNGKTKGLYKNKRTHRYKARAEYFQSVGNGYFKSKILSIVKAKEGNAAVLSAGASNIYDSLRNKYITDIINSRATKKFEEIKERNKEIDNEFLEINNNSQYTEEQKLQKQIELANKAKELTSYLSPLNKYEIRQTDAVDYRTHDKANNENVTRAVTLGKIALGKFVGPKIRDWLMSKTMIKTEGTKTILEEVKHQQPGKYNTDITLKDAMDENVGKMVEGNYSVSGGARGTEMYQIGENEQIRAIFNEAGNKEISLGDSAGFTSPEFTIDNFDSNLENANNILSQDIKVSKLLENIGIENPTKESLKNVFVSVGEKYWTKLSNMLDYIPGKTKTTLVEKVVPVTKYITNKHVASALKTLKMAAASEIVYDNARKTNSNEQGSNYKRYDTQTSYVGEKKKDFENMGKIVESRENTVNTREGSQEEER